MELKPKISYKMSYTSPLYIRNERKYLSDNLRFVDPIIRTVRYGGNIRGERHKCEICGRYASAIVRFLDMDTLTEFYVTDHCLKHPSTKIWPDKTTNEDITAWYEREDLKQSARNGDALARFALGDDYY